MTSSASRASGVSGWLLGLARVVGYLLVIAALLPSCSNVGGSIRTAAERDFVAGDPDSHPYRSEFRLGLPSSPLVHWFREKSVVDRAGRLSVEMSSGAGLSVLSWSMACLVA